MKQTNENETLKGMAMAFSPEIAAIDCYLEGIPELNIQCSYNNEDDYLPFLEITYPTGISEWHLLEKFIQHNITKFHNWAFQDNYSDDTADDIENALHMLLAIIAHRKCWFANYPKFYDWIAQASLAIEHIHEYDTRVTGQDFSVSYEDLDNYYKPLITFIYAN